MTDRGSLRSPNSDRSLDRGLSLLPFPSSAAHAADYYLSSEHAIHPTPTDLSMTNNDMPPYSIYGSPLGLGGGSVFHGNIHSNSNLTPTVTQPAPARKGRPRKRKSPIVSDSMGITGSGPTGCGMMMDSNTTGLLGSPCQNIPGEILT